MDGAARCRGRRQADIHAFGGEAGIERGGFQFGAARLDRGGQSVLQPVERGAAFAPLLGGGLAKVLEQGGERAVAAKDGHPHGVPGAQVGGGGEGGFRVPGEGEKIVCHPVSQTEGAARRGQPLGWSVHRAVERSPGRPYASAACAFLTISAKAGASS